ncbi:hypothetical protein H4219_001169 [Mycoemilia scoparia]|uniref:Zn(2)-C6 fungal-type domain-containing protein n=1 Tax=Mycoemilia scoparia TaxID=417184 RepID=A0A9W8A0U1_9FUNG|nr:hypothetical protein H4219_001169 [Mycoemilia scoparia]
MNHWSPNRSQPLGFSPSSNFTETRSNSQSTSPMIEPGSLFSHGHNSNTISPGNQRPASTDSTTPKVKLLQSCDFCRRRKVKCDGGKPVCSTCVRHKENCHYSPLAVPRRRTTKKKASSDAKGMSLASSVTSAQTNDGGNHDAHDPGNVSEADSNAHGSKSQANAKPHASQEKELTELRNEMKSLRTEFSSLASRMEKLMHLLTGANLSVQGGGKHEDLDQNTKSFAHIIHGDMIPKRSSDDSPDIKELAEKKRKLEEQLDNTYPQFKLPPGYVSHPISQMGSTLLNDTKLGDQLIELFYKNIDETTISLIPRSILFSLKAIGRAPKSLLYAMMADACMYSDHPSIVTFTHQGSRALFLEQAYRESIDCMRYDSVENCVTLLVFGLVICRAGFPRAWLMPALAIRMALRMRLYAMDGVRFSCVFSDNTRLQLEWKRRVFWQVFCLELLTSAAGTMPSQIYAEDVQCDLPAVESDAKNDEELAAVVSYLGPPALFCPTNGTLESQYQLAIMLSRINRFRNQIQPGKDGLFGPKFHECYSDLEAWKTSWPEHIDHDAILKLEPKDSDSEQNARIHSIYICLIFHFTRITLCLRKDNSIMALGSISEEDRKTLEWTRRVVYESSNIIQLFCPVLNQYSTHKLYPFISLCMYYSGLVSVFACEWYPRPEVISKAISDIEAIFKFMEYTAKSWGFSHELISALRRVIIECDFESKLSPKSVQSLNMSQDQAEKNVRKNADGSKFGSPPGCCISPNTRDRGDPLWGPNESTSANIMVDSNAGESFPQNHTPAAFNPELWESIFSSHAQNTGATSDNGLFNHGTAFPNLHQTSLNELHFGNQSQKGMASQGQQVPIVTNQPNGRNIYQQASQPNQTNMSGAYMMGGSGAPGLSNAMGNQGYAPGAAAQAAAAAAAAAQTSMFGGTDPNVFLSALFHSASNPFMPQR